MLSIIREGLPKNPRKWTEMCKQCMGVSEETTTGVKRLYEMQAQGDKLDVHRTPPDQLAGNPNHDCLVVRCSIVTHAGAPFVEQRAVRDAGTRLAMVCLMQSDGSTGMRHALQCVDTGETHDNCPPESGSVCACAPCLWAGLGCLIAL